MKLILSMSSQSINDFVQKKRRELKEFVSRTHQKIRKEMDDYFNQHKKNLLAMEVKISTHARKLCPSDFDANMQNPGVFN